ncbi:histidine kinase [Ruminococcaceae bacterium OttesenSCG-928-L11]|nr:histidine kinase [Ruminococcaceae bacterium OttesenSCG-928-L11]
MKRKPVRIGFRESIRRTFILYTLLPIAALVLLWGGGVLGYSQFAVKRVNQQVNSQIQEGVNRQYVAYTAFLEEMATDPDYLRDVRGENRVALNERLYRFLGANGLSAVFYQFSPGGQLIATNTWEAHDGFLDTHHAFRQIQAWLTENPGDIYHRARHQSRADSRVCIYTMAASIDGGFLVFDLLEESFAPYTASERVNYIVITDEYEYAVAGSDTGILDNIGRFRPGGEDIRRSRFRIGEDDYYLTHSAGPGPFQVFTLTSLYLQSQLLGFGFLLIAVSAVLLLAVMIRLSGRVADKNTAHLQQLMEAVAELEKGNLSPHVPSGENQFDEFEYLAGQYRKLVEQIVALLAHNRELAEITRQSEIRHLQAQFNPHFIFNVLETLKYEIHVDAEKSEQIITLLARLLRYSISAGPLDGLVSLEHDMQYIETYLALQKIRYDQRLEYIVSIPDMIAGCQLPKLIIQPLVENCIVHGYNRKETLLLTITGTLENGVIVLRVTDNGDGIPPQRLEEIQRRLAGREESDSIGLFNSNRRLQLLYGQGYGIGVTSIEGMGTEVVVTIPDQRRNERV